MSIRRAKSVVFSKPVRSNTTEHHRRIISDPYESDSDVSFVAERTCAVEFPTLLDKVSDGAAGLQHFGQSLVLNANHAIRTFVASDTEGSDQDRNGSAARRARRSRKKAISAIIGTCAASLKKVAEEVDTCNPEGLGHLVHSDDESWVSSVDERPKRRFHRNKKVASEATPHGEIIFMLFLD